MEQIFPKGVHNHTKWRNSITLLYREIYGNELQQMCSERKSIFNFIYLFDLILFDG